MPWRDPLGTEQVSKNSPIFDRYVYTPCVDKSVVYKLMVKTRSLIPTSTLNVPVPGMWTPRKDQTPLSVTCSFMHLFYYSGHLRHSCRFTSLSLIPTDPLCWWNLTHQSFFRRVSSTELNFVLIVLPWSVRFLQGSFPLPFTFPGYTFPRTTKTPCVSSDLPGFVLLPTPSSLTMFYFDLPSFSLTKLFVRTFTLPDARCKTTDT